MNKPNESAKIKLPNGKVVEVAPLDEGTLFLIKELEGNMAAQMEFRPKNEEDFTAFVIMLQAAMSNMLGMLVRTIKAVYEKDMGDEKPWLSEQGQKAMVERMNLIKGESVKQGELVSTDKAAYISAVSLFAAFLNTNMADAGVLADIYQEIYAIMFANQIGGLASGPGMQTKH